MAYLASELIERSYYLSGIVSQNLQSVSGSQQAEGLALLNALLAVKSADLRLVPYFNYTELDLITGQEKYYVPNLISVDIANFYIGPVRFPTQYVSPDVYFGQPRVDNVLSLPFTWTFKRELGGGSLYFYYLPIDNYVAHFYGKFSLQQVNLNTDLSLYLDDFYIEYLRYALAEYITSENNIVFLPQNANKLRELEQVIIDISPLDLSSDINSTLMQRTGYNWAFVNIPAWNNS